MFPNCASSMRRLAMTNLTPFILSQNTKLVRIRCISYTANNLSASGGNSETIKLTKPLDAIRGNKDLIKSKLNKEISYDSIEYFDINKPGSQIITESPFKTDLNIMKRFAYKLGIGEANIFAIRRSSIYIYAACTDQINVENFFKHCKLEDTIYSWFLITELHLWMCSLRSMAEGKEGRKLRNELTERLWHDIDRRLSMLEIFSLSVKKKVLEDLLSHLQAAMLSYDEGILTDDQTLAGALWRTFYSKNPNVDPELIELMVHYVRVQVAHLRMIGPHEWCLSGEFQWAKFPPLID